MVAPQKSEVDYSQYKKILTIDGGGMKGVFPASFLASLDSNLPHELANYFDLIVGTSTGGIIALALACGISPEKTKEFYLELGPKIFSEENRIGIRKGLPASKLFDENVLKNEMEKIFSNRTLGDCTTRVVIPSTNAMTGEVYIYKTSHHERFEFDWRKKIVDVAMATAAAPVFFPVAVAQDGELLVDGGLWANNPVGLSVVEAIGVLNWPPEKLLILSLGCTSEPVRSYNFSWWKPNKSIARLVSYVKGLIFSGQSYGSIGTAMILTGDFQKERLFRLDPILENDKYNLSSTKDLGNLAGLGNSEARKALPILRNMGFFDALAPQFEPFHPRD